MIEIVFATYNSNKRREVQAHMPEGIKLLSLNDIGCNEDIPETQNTIEGNAIQKANYIKTNYNIDCFADDTGLEVLALNGAPGVYSARYAGPEKNASNNMSKLLNALKNESNRSAQFKTVIALNLGGKTITFEGICKGEILENKQGEKGFGYDPIFKPENYTVSFAEMSSEEKNIISHRGIAIKKLVRFLSAYNK